MDKVHCLKRLYAKMTGKEITDPDVDTICEILHLLSDDITINDVEYLSDKFEIIPNTSDTNAEFTIENFNIKKTNRNYQLSLLIKIKWLADGVELLNFTPLNVKSLSNLDIGGVVGNGMLFNGGYHALAMTNIVKIEDKYNVNAYLSNKITTQLNVETYLTAQFNFIA